MSKENLVNLATRPQHEKSRIAKKGAEKTNELKKKKKEEEKKKQTLADILRQVVHTKTKPRKLKAMLADLGIDDESDYFTTLSASVLLHSIKKGDINALAKVMELLGEKPSEKIEVTTQDKTVAEIQKYLEEKKGNKGNTDNAN